MPRTTTFVPVVPLPTMNPPIMTLSLVVTNPRALTFANFEKLIGLRSYTSTRPIPVPPFTPRTIAV